MYLETNWIQVLSQTSCFIPLRFPSHPFPAPHPIFFLETGIMSSSSYILKVLQHSRSTQQRNSRQSILVRNKPSLYLYLELFQYRQANTRHIVVDVRKHDSNIFWKPFSNTYVTDNDNFNFFLVKTENSEGLFLSWMVASGVLINFWVFSLFCSPAVFFSPCHWLCFSKRHQ